MSHTQLFSILAVLLSCPALAAQRGETPPVIRVEAPQEEATASTVQDPGKDQTPGTSIFQPGGPSQPGTQPFPFGPPPPEAATDPTAPRPLGNPSPPFLTDRVALLVGDQPITTFELNEMVAYYQSFRSGSMDLLLRDAVEALLPRAALIAKYRPAHSSMRSRVQSAGHLLKGGRDWESVVKNHSDDKEEDAPLDGAYVFGRERAVQPFDRISHSAQKGKLTDPFLTVYGFHILQITDYERGELAKDDKTHVSHVLAMYPALRTLNQEGGDVRAEIKNITAAASIQVLEPGLKNMVPPKYRDQVIG